MVNAKGEVVALDLIKGSEYPVFDRQTSKNIGDRIFDNETRKPKPYQVKVNYEYDADICPSLTLPSIKRAQEQAPPEAEPVPKPELEPKPEPKPEPEPKPNSEAAPELEPEAEPVPKQN